ncbi:MAG: OadG family protein [Rubripirellula sp.]
MPMLLKQTGLTLLGQVDSSLPGSDSSKLAEGAVQALVGLMIVFTALILLSLFIAALPRVLAMLSTVWPEVDEPAANTSHTDSLVADDGAVLAAIGYVLHTEFQRQLETQDSSGQNS